MKCNKPQVLNKKLNESKCFYFVLLVFSLFFLYRVLIIFFPHPDIGGVEGNVIYFIQRILDSQPFYTNPEEAPYSIAQYSPLYYFLVAGTAKLFSLGPDDVFSIFITGRIISLLLNIALTRVVFVFCRNVFSVSVRRSIIAALASFIFLQNNSFARPDSLYHFIFLLSVYFFFLSYSKEEFGANSKKLLITSALFAVLALFSKQTAIVLPAIFVLWFLSTKKYRPLIIFSTTYIVSILLLLLATHYLLNLELFYQNAILGINNGISITWYLNVVLPFFYKDFGLLFLVASFFVLFLLGKDRRALMRLSGFFFIFFFFFLNAVALKIGSLPGYFTEWWIFLFILIAYYWPSIKKSTRSSYSWIPVTVVVTTFILKLGIQISPVVSMANQLSSPSVMDWYESEKIVAEKIKNKLLAKDKFVVFTNIYTPESFLSNFLFRHAVMPQMEIVALSTYPMKKYDYSEFENSLKSGKFEWMLMKQSGIQKQFFSIKLDNYQLNEAIGRYNLYQFKP